MASRFMGSGNRRPGIMGAIPRPVSNRRPRPPMRYIGEGAPRMGMPPGMGMPVPPPQGLPPQAPPPMPPQEEQGQTLSDLIMAYLGSDQADVYREDYDIDGDGEISLRDSIYQLQIQEGKRNPDGSKPITAEDIMAYLGETGPFMEGMDVNKDGTVDNLDSVWQLQIQDGLRNPDGTPVQTPPPPGMPPPPQTPPPPGTPPGFSTGPGGPRMPQDYGMTSNGRPC